MAASELTRWTVAIMVAGDKSLNKQYQITPNTKLVDVMEIWKEEFGLYGHWVFVSTSEGNTLDDWMTIEMVGEVVPNSEFVSLKAELEEPRSKPVSEIYAYVNGACHHIFVKPHEKLYQILWRLPGRPEAAFGFNGLPLNPRDSVEQAGLQNNSVIYQSLCQVTVKLSSGVSKVLEMTVDSLALHLAEKVSRFEINDFSLKCQGKLLNTDERVKDIKGVVEVSTVEFVVHVDGKYVTWVTKSEPRPFSDFVSHLSSEGERELESLKNMEYQCVGCRRRIRNSDDVQLLPMNCCEKQSLTLEAVSGSDKRTQSEPIDVLKYIQSLYEETTNSRATMSRSEYVIMKNKLQEDGLDYNFIVQCGEKLKKKINELEEKIRKLEAAMEKLKRENGESKGEIEKLKINNTESLGKLQVLSSENSRLKKENTRSAQDIKRLNEEKLKLEKTQGATAGAGPSRAPVEQLGVGLLVFYYPNEFRPVSRPEIQQGNYESHRWELFPRAYIKCRIPGISPGMTRFEAVRDVLRPLFIAGSRKIQMIGQLRATMSGRPGMEVSLVTLWEDDELVKDRDRRQLCSVGGEQFLWKDVKKTTTVDFKEIRAGDSVVICSGRRTVLWIFS